MKTTSIKLNIENPCNEDWGKMTASEKGRFCEACQKVVVDFSVMSDTQIIEFLSKQSGKVCGRIAKHQLNVPISNAIYEKKSFFNRYIAGVLMALGLMPTKKSLANAVKTEWHEQKASTKLNQTQNGSKVIIKGYIKEKGNKVGNKASIKNATLSLAGTDITVTCNKSGYYMIEVPETSRSNEVTLIIVAEGYEYKEETFDISNKKSINHDVLLTKEEQHLKGEIMIMGKVMAAPESH